MWAEVTVAARARGYRIECADAWIAATALRHDVPLVTHNRGDFMQPSSTVLEKRIVQFGIRVDW
jgi:predicted nucleic acid-binding protein